MKKNKWIYWVIAAGVYYWWWKKKSSTYTKKATPILQQASEVAADVVSKAVDSTSFTMDETTDRDLYAKDKANCQ
jgi:hypothetical protein